MPYREIIAVCSQIHTKHINSLCEAERGIAKRWTGYSDHWAVKGQISFIKTSQLMLYREIIAICSHIHKKHINTLRGAERRIVEC
jgi:hypothetical protein